MKNTLLSFIMIAILAPLFALPVSVGAQSKAFCARLSEVETAEKKKILDEEASYKVKKQSQLTLLAEKRAANDKKKAEERTRVDSDSLKRFEILFVKATSPAQKAAVITFKTTITDAIAAKRKVIDEAMNTYRTEVDQAVAQRKKATEDAWAVLVAAPQKAITQAKADCLVDKSKDNKNVQKKFETALKNAKKSYETSVKNLAEYDTTKALEKKLQEKLTKAQEEYLTLADKAVKELRATLQTVKK